MPDSNEGVACGTCGQPPCQCGDARLGAHHTESWYADHDFTLPAPVVPSDEQCDECGHSEVDQPDDEPFVCDRRYPASV